MVGQKVASMAESKVDNLVVMLVWNLAESLAPLMVVYLVDLMADQMVVQREAKTAVQMVGS